LSTYFRINAQKTGQFERTLIIADEGSYVSYLEGCTAPKRDENQLHAAVVELIALDDARDQILDGAELVSRRREGVGGIYNFVTKRGECRGALARFPGRRWRPVRRSPGNIRAASCAATIPWANSIRSPCQHPQQADTGTKMIHMGRNTRSRIISKGISAGKAQNTYRGLVSMHRKAPHARNFTQCDSLLIGDSAVPTPCPISKYPQPDRAGRT
jgi:Fe-S cluster assembly protein SufB